MTADVEMPPLPENLRYRCGCYGYTGQAEHDATVANYARACVAHATAPKDAEIKRLREAYRGQVIERANEIKLREKADAEIEVLLAKVERLEDESQSRLEACGDAVSKLAEAEARAERLAEALRAEIPVLRCIAGFGNMSDGMTDEVADRLEAALRKQENDDA